MQTTQLTKLHNVRLPHLVSLQKGVQHTGEEGQCSVPLFCYQKLMLGDLQSSSLHQQITGLLKVLQDTSEIRYDTITACLVSHATADMLQSHMVFFLKNIMYMVFLTCTVAPGRRMNSLDNMFLRKLKPLKTSSENKDQKYINLI